MAEPHFTATQLRARLDTIRATVNESRLAALTRKGYSEDWTHFQRFCARIGADPLPSSTDTLSLFIADQIDRHKVTTIKRRVAGIVKMHTECGFPSPASGDIRALLSCAKRMKCEQPRQMRALMIEELRAISVWFARRGTAVDLRNRAIFVVGFASALRSANLTMLLLSDVQFVKDGLILTIRKSKTDQQGNGQLIGIPHGKHPETCSVTCLTDWLRFRGHLPGPLFNRMSRRRFENPMGRKRIGMIVKQGVAAIGLDPKLHGGHSLRAGVVTELGEAGQSSLNIRRQTGHGSDAMVDRYFRRRDLFRSHPCSAIDL